MALGSTQPLVKMNTRNTSWASRRPVLEADSLTTFMCRMSWKSGSLNLLEPSGPHRACYGTPNMRIDFRIDTVLTSACARACVCVCWNESTTNNSLATAPSTDARCCSNCAAAVRRAALKLSRRFTSYTFCSLAHSDIQMCLLECRCCA